MDLGLSPSTYYTYPMNTYIILFRGINVGGKNIIKMKELVSLLEGLGLTRVHTYIQSGNVIFESESDSEHLLEMINLAILHRFGFSPVLLLLTLDEFETAMHYNPYPQASSDPKTLHMGFLTCVPEAPRLNEMEQLKTPTESFMLKDRVFYLYAPEGIGRSKLAANSERLLGVSMTDRNWNTICKIYALAKGEEK